MKMRFVRYGEMGAEKPGVLDAQGRIRDLSGVIPDLAGPVIADLPRVDPESLPLVPGNPRLGPPVGQVGKFIGIGLNYADHAAEAGMEPPAMPIVFMKATSSICGPNDPVYLPRGSQKGDWEVELGVIIGKRAKYVTEAEALNHVAGYCIVNDVSERAFQMERVGQWTKGKSADTFGPIGPWLVTPDEAGDPQTLDLTLDLNGKRVQTGNTATMIFTVAQIIAHLSEMMTLHPGDVIATGTPPGVGMGMKPQRFLRAGDVMELGIAGLGQQRQDVRQDA
jgi:2-keto-4-pentenoate hydratase/2-oxohepta-3-ene-1,7-dioic acid hydratase in catechol pathway